MKSRKTALTILLGLGLWQLMLWLQPYDGILEDKSYSRAVFDRDGRLLRLTLAADETYRLYTPLEEISPYIKEATLLYEDQYFYWHFGFNPVALVKAFWNTYILRSQVIGASTITMQLARHLYQIDSRNIPGKIHQIIASIWLEALYSKDEIYEAYLNLVPYGFNVEGVGAASFIYFHKEPRALTLLESLSLVVIPQSPYARTKNLRQQKVATASIKKARSKLLQFWLEAYPSFNNQSNDFYLELVMHPPQDLPFLAPHFVIDTLQRYPNRRLHSTLDFTLQKTFEELIRSYIGHKKDLGFSNASMMLLDTSNMEVLATVGSADFYNEKIAGQVNGTKARRSPGSTLKPFAYALAIDEGDIHAQSMIKDTDTPFGTYTPDNFDRQFAGPLTAENALIYSRNIPALRIIQNLQGRSLYQFLAEAGIPLNPDPKHYGLSIVLGSAEVSMEELVKLYAIFANEGQLRSIKHLTNEPYPSEKEMITAEASFMVRDMLAHSPRPMGGNTNQWALYQKHIAWKTGTSVGFRDAWAIAVFDHYVMAVWVGNFQGHGNPNFVGRAAAGELLFPLINALGQLKDVPFAPPERPESLNIHEVEVCAASGSIPSKECRQRKKSLFIPGVSPFSTCQIHRQITVDVKTGLQVCPKFKGKTITKSFEFWSTDLLTLFRKAGIGRRVPPTLHPDCRGESFGEIAPKILSPKPRISYQMRRTGTGSTQIPLMAVSDGSVKKLSWYVDNLYVGSVKSEETAFWKAKAGRHNIQVMDDHGRWGSVDIQVEWIE